MHGKETPVRAGDLKVGDSLVRHTTLVPAMVTKITEVERKGLYAPMTRSGTVVVDGLLASSYVSVQPGREVVHLDDQVALEWLYQSDLAHLWMGPLRLACHYVSSAFCGEVYHGEKDGMHQWVAAGLGLMGWFDDQPFVLQLPVGAAVFIPLVVMRGVELALEYALYAGLLLVAIVVLRTKKLQQKIE